MTLASCGVELGKTRYGLADTHNRPSGRVEVRKVVWPTRQETIQTTMVVMVVVIIVALFLWFLDWGLGGIARWVMGQGS